VRQTRLIIYQKVHIYHFISKDQIHGLYFRFKDLVNERAKRLFEGSENLSTVLNKAKIFEILNAEHQVLIRMTHGERAALYCDLPILLKLCIELVGGYGVEIEENLISEPNTETRDGLHEELIKERDILKKFIESFGMLSGKKMRLYLMAHLQKSAVLNHKNWRT
jgi:hypothetical protein